MVSLLRQYEKMICSHFFLVSRLEQSYFVFLFRSGLATAGYTMARLRGLGEMMVWDGAVGCDYASDGLHRLRARCVMRSACGSMSGHGCDEYRRIVECSAL